MKIDITVDPTEVAKRIQEDSSTVAWDYDGESFGVDGYLEDVIDAVLKTAKFNFDREDAELGELIRFPVVVK